MYITLEPCPMCAGAIINARLDKIYIGTMDEKNGACGSVTNVLEEYKQNYKVQKEEGIHQKECEEIIKIIHIFIAILITVLIATIIALLILKYNVEGEDNLPFELSKIMVISTAEGNDIEGEQTENKWNLKLSQNNDIYLEISHRNIYIRQR